MKKGILNIAILVSLCFATFLVFDFYQLTNTKKNLYIFADQINREIMQTHDISLETENHLKEEEIIIEKEYLDEKWLRYTLIKETQGYTFLSNFYRASITEIVWTSYI